MLHLTLNTGWIVEHPLSDSDEAALEQLSPLVTAGGGPLPAPHGAFTVEIKRSQGGAVFTISQADGPVVTCGVAWTASGAANRVARG